jgi:large subunit ribosomal protein L2
MALRKRKPTSPGRRFQTVSDFSDITKSTPEKSLLAPKHNTGGRNSYGRKTARHKGGGHKQQYRIIDFRRTKDGVPAKVAAIEYDPNRNARIALLHYLDGEKATSSPAKDVKVGDRLQSGQGADIKPATPCRCATSRWAPPCHNVELKPGGGGKMARSAGSSVQLVAKDGRLRHPAPAQHGDAPGADRLPGHVGEVGNAEAELVKIGKAGRNRWKGVRPQTRGVAMNPVDHPTAVARARPPVAATRVAVGQARGPHPRQEQAVAAAHRPPPPHPRLAAVEGTQRMPRSLKKGPFVDDHLLKKVDA